MRAPRQLQRNLPRRSCSETVWTTPPIWTPTCGADESRRTQAQRLREVPLQRTRQLVLRASSRIFLQLREHTLFHFFIGFLHRMLAVLYRSTLRRTVFIQRTSSRTPVTSRLLVSWSSRLSEIWLPTWSYHRL